MNIESLDDLLAGMIAQDASDLYLSVGSPPQYAINGQYTPIGSTPLSMQLVQSFIEEMLNPKQRQELENEMEINFSYSLGGKGRYRVNIYTQRGTPAMVIRQIKMEIPSFEFLRLPNILGEIIMANNGLILMTGAAGSGKSTTIASMIRHRNMNRGGHIITIEDPIEFVHRNKLSMISQREVGTDTKSFEIALKNTLRQAPEVIYIGEIRDRETMEFALHAAETGHLVVGTLHSTNANQALERVANFFPRESHAQLHFHLSLNLRAIISQRLIRRIAGGRTPAVEILLRTPHVSNLIAKGEINQIKEAMKSGEEDGMLTFDSHLHQLVKKGEITEADALQNADSPNNLRLKLAGMS